jgi:Peptidase propeptide and YPEB domain
MSQTRLGVALRDIARPHARCFFTVALAVASMGAFCEPLTNSPSNQQTKPETISRERAIEIARQEVRETTDTVEAIQTTTQGRVIWRVTFKRRLLDAPPGLFETRIVEIDAGTGELIGVFMS